MSEHEDQAKGWKIVSEDVRYETPWIRVSHHDVIAPTGAKGIYGCVHVKNIAVGMLPVDNEGHTWLVGQDRFPFQDYTWELPQGGGNRAHTPLETAERELSEECNLAAENYLPLYEHIMVSNCISDEIGYGYIAWGLSDRPGKLDDTEDLAVKRVPLPKVMEMIETGEIRDGFTILMMARASLLAAKGKLPAEIAKYFL